MRAVETVKTLISLIETETDDMDIKKLAARALEAALIVEEKHEELESSIKDHKKEIDRLDKYANALRAKIATQTQLITIFEKHLGLHSYTG